MAQMCVFVAPLLITMFNCFFLCLFFIYLSLVFWCFFYNLLVVFFISGLIVAIHFFQIFELTNEGLVLLLQHLDPILEALNIFFLLPSTLTRRLPIL